MYKFHDTAHTTISRIWYVPNVLAVLCCVFAAACLLACLPKSITIWHVSIIVFLLAIPLLGKLCYSLADGRQPSRVCDFARPTKCAGCLNCCDCTPVPVCVCVCVNYE